MTEEDCDDLDALKPNEDADCDGVLTEEDCDDSDVGLLAQLGDNDCDGILSGADCDDGCLNMDICKTITLSNGTDFVKYQEVT